MKYDEYRYSNPAQIFEDRKKMFFEKQENYRWLSWNAVDEFVKTKLVKPQSIAQIRK